VETTTGVVVALGEHARLAGYALAGVRLVDAVGPPAVLRAWALLGEDVALVLLTPAAAEAVAGRTETPGAPLSVVLPG
jgi:vacuolar-type H+-ATPase subunit F/Vma7